MMLYLLFMEFFRRPAKQKRGSGEWKRGMIQPLAVWLWILGASEILVKSLLEFRVEKERDRTSHLNCKIGRHSSFGDDSTLLNSKLNTILLLTCTFVSCPQGNKLRLLTQMQIRVNNQIPCICISSFHQQTLKTSPS